MEKTDEQIASLIEKLQAVGFGEAPEFFETVIEGIYLKGMIQMSFGVFFLILFLISLGILITGAIKDSENSTIVGAICTIPMFFITIGTMTIGSPWLRILNPEAVLYLHLLSKVL